MKSHRSAAYDNPHQSAKHDLLHPKNPYFNKPLDFYELYKHYYDDLAPFFIVKDYFKRKPVFNFKDPAALRALTRVLLKKDFRITIPKPIPDSYLCPPLPNRLNYLCWVDDLTQSTSSLTEDIVDDFGVKRPLVIDIGTGIVGIYTLLGSIVFGFRFIASDINSSTLEFVQEILTANPHVAQYISLVLVPDSSIVQGVIKSDAMTTECYLDVKDKIFQNAMDPVTWGPIRHLFHSSGNERLYYRLLDANYQCSCLRKHDDIDIDQPEESMLPLKKKRGEDNEETDAKTNVPTSSCSLTNSQPQLSKFKTLISAVMTNPPFYDNEEIIHENEETSCSGNSAEMRTNGGEVAFITAMILDSLVLRERYFLCRIVLSANSNNFIQFHLFICIPFI